MNTLETGNAARLIRAPRARRVVPLFVLTSALVVGSAVESLIPIAHAQTASASPISNTTVPGGAPRLSDRGMRESVGKFLRALAEERKLTPGESSEAELFFWKAPAYKEGRVTFWRAAFKKSLESAGYKYTEFDSHDIVTNISAQEYGLIATDDQQKAPLIDIGISDTQNYFVATHPESGATFIGMWLDQKDDNQCLLAIQQAGAILQVKRAPLPGVAGANVLLVQDPLNVMKGAVGPKSPTFAAMSPKPRTVRGMVKTPGGKPVAGATIRVQASAVGGLATIVTAETNAQGIYEVPLPVGVCQVESGFCRVSYNGASFFLPLQAVDDRLETFRSAQGHVENFTIRTWGLADPDNLAKYPKGGESYYGAPLRVQWFQDQLPESATMEVTLKPQGPLIDGTTGRTLVVRLPAREGMSVLADQYINNVPIGRYIMTAQVLDEGERMAMKIETVFNKTTPVESFLVDFKPHATDYAVLKRSGIERFDVVLKP